MTALNDGSNSVAWMNFYNYTSLGQRDYLTTPLLNFQGFESVFMTFKYAYAQRYFQKDSLIVNLSNDCGETWTRIYANGPDGGGVFETAETTADFFIPQNADDWCGSGYGATCPVLDLSEWAGQANIKLQFETYANYGNNLYLDNIDISETVGIFDQTEKLTEAFIFYPNPSTGELNVINKGNVPGKLSIHDLQGRLVMNALVENKRVKLDLKTLQNGIYFIRFEVGNNIKTRKLVIQ